MTFSLHILKSNCFITIFIFGIWYVFIDIIFHIIPLGILFAGSLSIVSFYLRVPPPEKKAVETILGVNPNYCNGDDNGHVLIKTIGHRGAGLDAPENSLVAFKLCADKGISAIEFDVSLTADGVPVVFHDDTLERLTDLNAAISSLTWSELSKIDISIKHPYKDKFKNTFIPTLDDTVKQLYSSEQCMFIDLKGSDTRIVQIILDLFKTNPNLYSRAIVTSFYPHLIYLIRKKNPKIVCSLAWRPYAFTYQSYNYPQGVGPRRSSVWYKHFFFLICDFLHEWCLNKFTYYLCGLSIILLHKDVINGKVVEDWNKKGIRVIAWTVNHPVEKQHFSRVLKVTYMTDTLVGETTAHNSFVLHKEQRA